MAHEILVYFDYKSPYTFVGKAATYALESELGVKLTWLPYAVDLSGVTGTHRSEATMRKLKYLYMDARRFAAPQGLTVKGPERVFDSSTALIGMLFVQAQGKLRPYHDEAFERFFRRGFDVGSVDAVEALLHECGVATEGFRAYLAGPGAAELARIRKEADEHGVFGVPTFVLEGELF